MKVLMGKAFAFIHRELVSQDLSSLDPDRHHVICSLGQGAQVDEFTLPNRPLPEPPDLRIVTCDKDLYYENKDAIHLLIYDPLAAGQQCDFILRQGTVEVRRFSPILGDFGQGSCTLECLPVGDYEVVSKGEVLCSFKVAAYSLSPLVATLLNRVKESESLLRVTLKVESYGVPVQGGIWVTLRSATGRGRRVFGLAKNGVVRAILELDEEGSYVLDVQHAEDTELTARVPLPGTSKEDRTDVPLFGMNPFWQASLLPQKDSVATRGLHLSSRPDEESPFHLERTASGRARLTARQSAAPVSVAVLDPCRQAEPVVHDWESVEAGQVLEFELPGPIGVVAVGAYLEEQPWEGWAMTLAPAEVESQLRLPESVNAGDEVTVKIETSARACYLLVKDTRLQSREGPADRTASRLLASVRRLRPKHRSGPLHQENKPVLRERLEKLVEDCLKSGVLKEEQCRQVRRQAAWMNLDPEQLVASMLGISQGELLARMLGVEFTGLVNLDPELARTIPEHLARRYRCVPVAQKGANVLVLAMVDPRDIIAIDDITLITGFTVEPALAPEDEILSAINQQYGVTDLVEVEETVKDISAQDFGFMDFDDEVLVLDKLKESFTAAEAPEELEEQAETGQAEVLFAGWLEPVDGLATATMVTPSMPGDFKVEVFSVGELDWSSTEARLVTSKQLAMALELPPFVHPDDQVEGRVRILNGQPPFRLRVERDGEPMELPEVLEGRKPVSFLCEPGKYVATVEEIATGRRESVAERVEVAGRISGVRKTLQWLSEGQSLSRESDSNICALRALDGITEPANRLGEATANYSHLCCEQTAAKILSACSLWASSSNGKRGRMESIIRAGIDREKSMFLPGRGFSMYPGGDQPCSYWGPKAATYLCQLELMRDFTLDPEFAEVIELGIRLGKAAAKDHGVSWPPTSRKTAAESYMEARFGAGLCPELVALAENDSQDEGWGRVGERIRDCYRAAILLRSRQNLSLATRLVNEVFQDLQASGRLYSTADSVAAIALFAELRAFRPEGWGKPSVEGDPEDPIMVEATSGDALVEVTRKFEDDWQDLTPTTSVEVALSGRVIKAGQKLTLSIGIPDGYRFGDLVWVCLPKSLAQLRGGGQVRRFSVDFEGNSKIHLDLAAVSPTGPEGETVLLCLRNMFLEERVGLMEPTKVRVEAAAVSNLPGIVIEDELALVDLTREGLSGSPKSMRQIQMLSGEIHRPELHALTSALLEEALRRESSHLVFDWVDEGVARCRFQSDSGTAEAVRFPARLQTLIVGLLQMLSKNSLGVCGPQQGKVALGEGVWPVSILPTNVGMMATLELQETESEGLSYLQALSRLQIALGEGRTPELKALRAFAESQDNPGLVELIETVEKVPLPKQKALELLAKLAKPGLPV